MHKYIMCTIIIGNYIIHIAIMHACLVYSRVESRLDDPDNLGYFFDGSSWSHPQTKINYLDVTQIFNRSHALKKTALASGK